MDAFVQREFRLQVVAMSTAALISRATVLLGGGGFAGVMQNDNRCPQTMGERPEVVHEFSGVGSRLLLTVMEVH
jgi:hypothetical protein